MHEVQVFGNKYIVTCFSVKLYSKLVLKGFQVLKNFNLHPCNLVAGILHCANNAGFLQDDPAGGRQHRGEGLDRIP